MNRYLKVTLAILPLFLFSCDKQLRIRVCFDTNSAVLSYGAGKKEEALGYLEKCVLHWEKVIELTIDRYAPMPYVSMGHHEPKWPAFTSFHWSHFLEEVQADLDYVKQLGRIKNLPNVQ